MEDFVCTITHFSDGSSYAKCTSGTGYNLGTVEIFGRAGTWEEPSETSSNCANWDICLPDPGSCAENPGMCWGGTSESPMAPPEEPMGPGIDPIWFRALNDAEKTLCRANRTMCRGALVQAVGASAWARDQTPEEGTVDHNNKRDALRHARWQAGLARVFNETYAKSWGDAHETSQAPTDPASCMDQHNNRVGREAARGGGDLNQAVLIAWQTGTLRGAPSGCP